MEGDRDSKEVVEEKHEREVVGEQDKEKKMEEELEKKAKRMQEKRKGKKVMEEDNAKEMEEELEKKAKRMQEIKKGKKKVEGEEECEWEWEWAVEEGQEVGLIKNQEADNNIKKKSFVSKLVSRLSKEPKVDDDPLTERLITLEIQRELRWRVRRIFSNGGNIAPGAFEFDKALEALHSLKVHIFKEQVLPYYDKDYQKLKTLPESSASLAELQKEFQTRMKRILSEEGSTDLNAHEHAFNLLSTIQCLQDSKSREEEYEQQQHLQDSVPSLCGICQIPMTETIPFDEQIALDVPDEYAKYFHRACLNSWLRQPWSKYLPRANDYLLSCKTIILKMISGWKNQLEIYETRKSETIRDEIASFIKKKEGRFNKLIKKISSANIAKREKGIAELNNIHQNIKVMTEFKGFLCHNPEVIPALLRFLVATETSLNIEVQDDILTAVLHACNKKTNKKWIGKDPFILPHLIIALESELTVRIKVKCAAALITLSDDGLYYNKIKIGELGAIRQLAKLLEERHKEAKKAAALAIVSLCMAPENHQKALEANMVNMAVGLILQKIVVEESLMTLWLLRNNQPAMTVLVSHEMVEQFLSIVLRNPSNPIQPEIIEVACHVLIQRDQGEYYRICRKIIAVFRKSLRSTDSQREENILWWLKFSTNIRNREKKLCDEVHNEWWNFIK